MLFSGMEANETAGAGDVLLAVVGDRLERKIRRPIASAAAVRRTTPVVAHFGSTLFAIEGEVVAVPAAATDAALNFSGSSGLPRSLV